jgi:enolase
MLNGLNGGRHADNSVDFQEFVISPVGAPSFRDGLRDAVETFHTLKSLLLLKGYRTAVGDEEGLAPEFESNEEPIQFILDLHDLCLMYVGNFLRTTRKRSPRPAVEVLDWNDTHSTRDGF